jgi:uncharacterized LabA/DUF88 family protein
MKTIVYIDGLNLYYGCIKNTDFRWLNLGLFCESLLPKVDIAKIKYYYSLVQSRPDDPGVQSRQNAFIRALKTVPKLELVKGKFKPEHDKWVRLENDRTKSTRVVIDREKRSDVNLAVQMVTDGFKNQYDFATVISGDSDLKEAFRIVSQELGKKIALIHPARDANSELARFASIKIPIREHHLRDSQFPPVLRYGKSEITKPAKWGEELIQPPKSSPPMKTKMSALLVTFEPNSPEEDNHEFLNAIKEFASARLSGSSYAIATNETPQQVFEKLKSKIPNLGQFSETLESGTIDHPRAVFSVLIFQPCFE